MMPLDIETPHKNFFLPKQELLYEDIPVECEETCVCGGSKHVKVYRHLDTTDFFFQSLPITSFKPITIPLQYEEDKSAGTIRERMQGVEEERNSSTSPTSEVLRAVDSWDWLI